MAACALPRGRRALLGEGKISSPPRPAARPRVPWPLPRRHRRTRRHGFDSGGNVFRAMPHIGAIVAFEESSDETRGHSFVVASDELRLVTLDDILVALPPRWWRRKTRS